MTLKPLALCLLAAACLLILFVPVQADAIDDKTVIYQTSFASDPHWITNSPSSDYWEPTAGRYHFSIEPSTGGYAYVPIDNFQDTSFTLDYDLLLIRVDENAAFRLGFSSKEMNPEKGPSVITRFTNAKYGRIAWLDVVTPSNKIMSVNSQSGATAFTGSTFKYDVNTTYHVTVNYNKDRNLITMSVKDKQTGQDLWSYFIQLNTELAGMNRIWIGSIGDYGPMNIYAQGYLDNVQLTVPSAAATIQTTQPADTSVMASATTAVAATPTRKTTPKTTIPTAYPTTTESPLPAVLPVAAIGAAAALALLRLKKDE